MKFANWPQKTQPDINDTDHFQFGLTHFDADARVTLLIIANETVAS